MPAVGLEPTRGCPQQILSLPRLPFRHAGIETSIIISRFCRNSKGIFEFFLIFHKPRFRIHIACLDQFLISGKQLLRKSDSYGFVDRKSFFSNIVQCCTVDPDHFDCRALVKSSGIYMSDTGRKYKISQFRTLCKCVAANSFYSAAKSYVPQIRALAERIFSNRCYIISKNNICNFFVPAEGILVNCSYFINFIIDHNCSRNLYHIIFRSKTCNAYFSFI